ncbi:ABC transporter permease [Brachybacterium sp. Z12]|uniref:ABC transporter permease n=1 Tax=Brachybacterium sp. Z12 TaxID=2759167 RepID=UPI00223B33CB|nr:hypothetical protein [Brachybacterium sp. Z12]
MSPDGTQGTSAVRDLIRRPYFWGIIAIALLLLVNTLKDPGYLAVSYNETTGSLVGNVIDILRAAAPIAMISVGMCLVIATAGIDLSVGSVMAVAGAVAMELLASAGGSPVRRPPHWRSLCCWERRSARSTPCWSRWWDCNRSSPPWC